MHESLSSFYIVHSLLQCLVCCQHIIHWHCDLNSSLLSRIPPPEGISLEVRKLIREAGHQIRLAWHQLRISFGEKNKRTKHFCFSLFSFFKQDSWYFTWGAAHEQIAFRLMVLASWSGFLMVNVASPVSIYYSAGESGAVIKLLLL